RVSLGLLHAARWNCSSRSPLPARKRSACVKPADNWPRPVDVCLATKYSERTDCQNNKKHVADRGVRCEHTGCYSKSFGQSRQRQSDNSFTQERHCHSPHQRPRVERADEAPCRTG